MGEKTEERGSERENKRERYRDREREIVYIHKLFYENCKSVYLFIDLSMK